jgi:hypothetical protein
MAVKLKVTYLDGREVTVLASPRAQVMAEQHFSGTPDAKRIEQTYYLAWASLNRSGQEPADFDTFLDAITDVDEVENEPPDPTPTVPTSDTSSP